MMMMMMKGMKGNLKGDDHVKQAHVAAGLVTVQAHEAQGSHLHVLGKECVIDYHPVFDHGNDQCIAFDDHNGHG